MIGSFCQIQSTSNAAISRGPLSCSQTEQGLKSRHGLVTPIMAENELIEINLELRAADAVVGADQPLLKVADSTVGQGHYRVGPLAQFGAICCWIKPLSVVALKSGITAIRSRPDALPRFSTATKTRAARRPLS